MKRKNKNSSPPVGRSNAADVSHLLEDEQPGSEVPFANLADLTLTLKDGNDEIRFPCHSALLARHSKVLCELFAAPTEREGWEGGVNAPFAGFPPKTVRLMLKLVHAVKRQPVLSLKDVEGDEGASAAWQNIEALLSLADKLDSRCIREVSLLELAESSNVRLLTCWF